MKNLRLKNPKEFWKLFNRDRKRESTNISMQSLFDFFKDLNRNKYDTNDDFIILNDVSSEQDNVILNGKITHDEVKKAVKNTKNNKSPGVDDVINEYISTSLEDMIDVYVQLFNLIFDSGILPEMWLIGCIIPIFKNKGDKFDPKNYRPITLLSCLGKIFTSILDKFIEEFYILHENQAGFRHGYSTNDHIFRYMPYLNYFVIAKRNYIAPSLTMKKRLTLFIEITYCSN